MGRHDAQPVAIVVNDKDFPGPDFLVYWKFFNYILRIPPFRLTANLNITYLEALVNPWTGNNSANLPKSTTNVAGTPILGDGNVFLGMPWLVTAAVTCAGRGLAPCSKMGPDNRDERW